METIDRKWYDNKVLIHVLLVLFFPVGLYGIWKNTELSKLRKIITSAIVVFVILTIVGGKDNKSSNVSQNSSVETVSEQQKETSENLTKETISKQQSSKVELKENQSNHEEMPEWNTGDLDAMANGNIEIAAKEIKKVNNSRSVAINPAPANVKKRPWDYYGKIIKITGTVAVVQDYPPSSDYSKMLGSPSVSTIVMETADGTIAQFLLTKSASNINVGDVATAFGFPVGTAEVDNTVGGTFTHVMFVGNDFVKQ